MTRLLILLTLPEKIRMQYYATACGASSRIWPASLALPAGYRLALTLQGKDFERPGEPGPQKGSGWFLHDDPRDRPAETFAGTHSTFTGGGRESYLLLPMIDPA